MDTNAHAVSKNTKPARKYYQTRHCSTIPLPSYTFPTFNYGNNYDYAYTSAHDVAQAIIDSKCYELTVSPLVDVSEAYGVPPGLEFSLFGAGEEEEEEFTPEDLFSCFEVRIRIIGRPIRSRSKASIHSLPPLSPVYVNLQTPCADTLHIAL
ncbi:hypothetical protein D9758_015056 [Tetrapyrgos nigripes]|uniref:Uncharacterized protein n=1 Tax=Tetrapyrgos nigripes TaxID=182062 RepID=A0A8H5CSY1_9AGAR|nr:hypothetical protein D9758_015056 [Tetrapyrgos nigripes]